MIRKLIIIFLVLSQCLYAEQQRFYSIPIVYSPNIESRVAFCDERVSAIFPASKTLVTFKANSSGYFETDTFFINYQLFTPESVKIEMTLNPLTKTTEAGGSTETVNYKVSPGYLPEAHLSDGKAFVVYSDFESKANTSKPRTGSIPIALRVDIEKTENFSSFKNTLFEGQISLTVSGDIQK